MPNNNMANNNMANNNMANNNMANNNMQNNKYVFRIGSSASITSDSGISSDTGKNTKKEITKKISRKTGRPLKVAGRCKTKYVKVFCTEEDYQDFRKYCDDTNSSGSELLYRYLKRLIKNNKKI